MLAAWATAVPAGCATGELTELPDAMSGGDAEQRRDSTLAQEDLPRPDLQRPDSRPWDLRPADQPRPQDGSPSDSTQSCTDFFEPNNTCALAGDLGSVYEGNGYSGQSATLHPVGDIDWFWGRGLEVASFCWPGDPQCYRLKVRLDVPAGRQLRVCLYRGSCTSGPVCDSNLDPGPTALELSYTVAGTCGGNDDTTAFIQVTAEDATGGCAPYGIAFRYDPC